MALTFIMEGVWKDVSEVSSVEVLGPERGKPWTVRYRMKGTERFWDLPCDDRSEAAEVAARLGASDQ